MWDSASNVGVRVLKTAGMRRKQGNSVIISRSTVVKLLQGLSLLAEDP